MYSRPFLKSLAVAVVLVGTAVMPCLGQISGLNYTVTPGIERVLPDDGAGLDAHFAPSLRVGIGFGSFVVLTGSASQARNVDLATGSIPDLSAALMQALADEPARSATVNRYGAELRLNLSRRSLSPFLVFGTGIRRLDVDGLPVTESILARGAIGVRYRLRNRIALTLQASTEAYRYVPATAFLSEEVTQSLESGDLGRVTVRDYAIGAGLTVFLGGRPENSLTAADRAMLQRMKSGLRGLSLVVEPFVGTVSFDRALAFPRRQTLVGAHVGIDLGPYVGLRGFYWRGASSAPVSFEDLQAYGGEIKLNFTTDYSGMRPFLSLGGGLLDVRGDYTGRGGIVPEDQPFALAGGGIQLPLSRSILLHGAARTLLIASEGTGEISTPESVTSNWMFSAGISVGIGGGKSPAELLREAEAEEAARRDDAARLRQAELETALGAAQARADSLALALREAPAADSAAVAAPVGQAPDGQGRWMTIPVPSEGEIYIRFGRPDPASPLRPGTSQVMLLDPDTGTYRTFTDEAGSARPSAADALISRADSAAAVLAPADSVSPVSSVPGRTGVDAPIPVEPGIAPPDAGVVDAAPAGQADRALIQDLEARVRAAEARAVQAERLVADLEARVRATDALEVEPDRRVAELEERLQAAEERAVAPDRRVAELEERLQAAEARAVQAEEARDRLEGRLQDEEVVRQREREELRDERSRLQDRVDRLEESLRSLEREAREDARRREQEAREQAQPQPTEPVPDRVPADSVRTDSSAAGVDAAGAFPWDPYRPTALWGSLGYGLSTPHNALIHVRAEFGRRSSHVRLFPGLSVGFGSDTRVYLNGLVGTYLEFPSANGLAVYGAAGPTLAFGGGSIVLLTTVVGISYPVGRYQALAEFDAMLLDQGSVSLGVRRTLR